MLSLAETIVYGDVTLRPLKESDIPLLWELYEPKIFEFMLNKIENKEQLNNWLQVGIHQMEYGTNCTFICSGKY